MAYKRIMLKLSGEALCKEGGSGQDEACVRRIVDAVKPLLEEGIQVAIVVGGGNIWRYRDHRDENLDRVESDRRGMIATVSNGIALKESLEGQGITAYVCTAIDSGEDVERYDFREARKHLDSGDVTICTGGTGNPYFTTDSAAALRALELNCDVLLKATNVDGVYDKDPDEHTDAKLFEELAFDDAIDQDLKVMDQAAFSLCRENGLPVRVFNFNRDGALLRAAKGEKIGTLVHG